MCRHSDCHASGPNPVIWGTVTLVLSYSAYVSEVIRAGIESVHESQRAAARSLGMSNRQTMSTVVLPQAFRRIVPPLMNSFVSLQKDVALVSLIGPVEILRQAGIDKAKTANFTPYVAAAAIFLLLTIPCTRLADLSAGSGSASEPARPRSHDPRRQPPSPGRTGAKISLRGVRKAFGETVVLDGIDLEVGHGRRDHD